MKPRLLLILLALVVLPTALLSFLASRAFKEREALLAGRLESAGLNAARGVADRIRAHLDSDLDRVCAAMSDCLARGGDHNDLHETAARLQRSGDSIRQVYLFMSPWGFVYPEERDVPSAARRDPDLNLLRRQLSTVATPLAAARFAEGGTAWCFAGLRDRAGLYGGYEVDFARLSVLISNIVRTASGQGLELVVEGPGFVVHSDRLGDDVAVMGPFSEQRSAVSGQRSEVSGQRSEVSSQNQAVQSGSPTARPSDYPTVGLPDRSSAPSIQLASPLDCVRVTVYLRAPAEVSRAAESRVRLELWGIVLLGGTILFGTWTLVRQVSAEVRLARARNEYLVGISHDLRTPLAGLKVMAESLAMGRVKDPARQQQFMDIIVRESSRLSQMVERVLFFVRMDEPRLAFRFESVDAMELANAAVRTFLDRFDEGNRPEVEVVHTSPLLLHADEGAMMQVLLNLLDNAWKYSACRGPGPVRIEVKVGGGGRETTDYGLRTTREEERSEVSGQPPSPEASDSGVPGRPDGGEQGEALSAATPIPPYSHTPIPDPCPAMPHAPCTWRSCNQQPTTNNKQPCLQSSVSGSVRISIRDHGIGMEKRDLKRIFRRFHRGATARELNISGVGLGLALCKLIVEGHGGRIEVESEVGQGSVFTVVLPVGSEQ